MTKPYESLPGAVRIGNKYWLAAKRVVDGDRIYYTHAFEPGEETHIMSISGAVPTLIPIEEWLAEIESRLEIFR